MILIHYPNRHVSNDTVLDFEDELLKSDIFTIARYNFFFSQIRYLLYRCLRKMSIDLDIVPKVRSVYTTDATKDKKHLFAIMMGIDEQKWRTCGIHSCHNKSIYLFDAWPSNYGRIISFCKKYKINFLFITSQQSTIRLSAALPQVSVHYIPEAITVSRYYYLDYTSKNIDVLAYGRKWDKYHESIVDRLSERNVSYLYEKNKGELIFPDRKAFLHGLAATKISICVPSNITHPSRAGDVETMTVRYLESMASKCLILGIAPKEMIDLFGYNPIIEIDWENPVEQILLLLKNYDNYIPLIEKNYSEVSRHHSWANRCYQMMNIWKGEMTTN